jgi:hypothetical protein
MTVPNPAPMKGEPKRIGETGAPNSWSPAEGDGRNAGTERTRAGVWNGLFLTSDFSGIAEMAVATP